ncbi:MAG: hypothetical protein AAFY65_09695 [Pseudomonadota bacterium]
MKAAASAAVVSRTIGFPDICLSLGFLFCSLFSSSLPDAAAPRQTKVTQA